MNASSWTNPVVFRRILLGLARRVQTWSRHRGLQVRGVVIKVPDDVDGDVLAGELRSLLAEDTQCPIDVSVHPVAGPVQVWSIESS